MLTKWY